MKQPVAGMSYLFANRLLIPEDQLLNILQRSKTTFNSPIVNEAIVLYMLAIGAYSYIAYKLFMGMKDMHGYKGKEKKDIEN